jgi:thymidylate synthase (FAD)
VNEDSSDRSDEPGKPVMSSARPDEILVLDNGFVRLVNSMGDDLTVVNAARVSFNKQSSGFEGTGIPDERDRKLIQYLAKHKHWTPFAHAMVTLHIKAPIPIRAQFAKHTVGLVMNEVSRRYVTDTPEFYNPIWRTSPTNGAKQGSSGFVEDDDTYHDCCTAYENSINQAVETYNRLLERGIAPEQARFVLPQGLYTEWWWTGSLAAFSRVVGLRADSHAQWEIREYANAFKHLIRKLFPISWDALTNQ